MPRYHRLSKGRLGSISLCFLLTFLGCDSDSTTTTTKTPTISIAAQSVNGESKLVQADAGTDIVFMATWCPHSKALKEILSDSRLKPYLANRRIDFLFGDEWPTIEKKLKEMADAGKFPSSQIPAKLAKLRKHSGHPLVFDPLFFQNLPGSAYTCTLPAHVNSFPQVATNDGYQKTTSWLVGLSVPVHLINQLFEQYDPD